MQGMKANRNAKQRERTKNNLNILRIKSKCLRCAVKFNPFGRTAIFMVLPHFEFFLIAAILFCVNK